VFLHSLRICAYRNYVDMTVQFEPGCTVLIGENNAGKTNVLDALYSALRVNRTIRQGAFDLSDYHLSGATSMAGDAGPIQLTATFQEREEDEWPEEIVSQLSDVINQVKGTSLQSVLIQVTSTAPGSGREEVYDWNFLDAGGAPRKKQFAELTTLQKLRPFFALSALRDVSREFSKRSTYFGPFITDPTFDEEVRSEITTSLDSINAQVLAAHGAFEVLKRNLNEGNRVVQAMEESATIEAVPSRISDLLANTQVSFQNPSGVSFPVDKHGSGTQSLSVLSLFRAYIAAKLESRSDPLSRPIVTIEEPEVHLHPTAVRSLWERLKDIPGQAIVTSHSGDFVSEVPLRALRRLWWDGRVMKCSQVDEKAFTDKELRNINYQIRASRGELLFARKWILLEGRSDIALLPQIARIVGCDLLGAGVRLVEIAQHGGPVGCIKLADQLGISWKLFADGDGDGLKYANAARAQLNGRVEADHIYNLPEKNLEVFLCKNGFLPLYLAACPAQNPVTSAPGTEAYYLEVAEKTHKKNEELALAVVVEIENNPLLVPGQLLSFLREACR
jgi:putative ATP-dependent endonuclease of the OLD family